MQKLNKQFIGIAAMDLNRAIGYQGQLVCRHPEDMKFFKQTTTNGAVIMGRKTFESIGSRALPNRLNIILSSRYIVQDKIVSLQDPLSFDWDRIESPLYVIGGASVYNFFLPHMKKFYLTKFYDKVLKADTFLPELSPFLRLNQVILSNSAFQIEEWVDNEG
jgi:dihydrofolate reductase